MKLILSALLALSSALPVGARADDVHAAASYVFDVEGVVNQGARALVEGSEDLSRAGRRALVTIRGRHLGEVINVGIVKAATRHALAQAGQVISDVDFDTLFAEQTKNVVAALLRGELGVSGSDLSFGKSSLGLFQGFGTIALACISNGLSSGICVAAGGVAVIVGIVLIAQALTRPAAL